MQTLDIQEALLQIADILEQAFLGEEIIIKKNDQQIIKISSIAPVLTRPPLFGSDKNIIYIADDFDDPLEEFKEYM